MSPEAFNRWLLIMLAREAITSSADAARKLGVTPNTILNYRHRGCDRKTALACAALARGLEPWK
jgi:DNA-binding CsgD family transcriptional regulator